MNDFTIVASLLSRHGGSAEWRGDFLITTFPWGSVDPSCLATPPGHTRYFLRERIECVWHVPDWWNQSSFHREWANK